jgi:hypothetical protein
MLREFALIDAKQSSGGSQLRGGYHQQFFAKEINYDVLNIYNDMSSITSTGLLTFWPIGLMHSPDNPLRRLFLTSNRHNSVGMCGEPPSARPSPPSDDANACEWHRRAGHTLSAPLDRHPPPPT